MQTGCRGSARGASELRAQRASPAPPQRRSDPTPKPILLPRRRWTARARGEHAGDVFAAAKSVAM